MNKLFNHTILNLLSYFYNVKQVLVAAKISDSFINTLISKGYELINIDSSDLSPLQDTSLITGIITSNKLMLNQQTIQQFTNLTWIARLGSGMEIIDTGYCDLKGIRYYSSPNGIANSVAEHVLGMLLSLLHNIYKSFSEITHAQWIREANRGYELEDKIVGIIGYGHTGQALARKLQVFTKHILVYDKYRSNIGHDYIQEVTLEYLLQHADIISFHVPLTNETTHYYDQAFIDRVTKPHILINASRGAVADTSAILNGLKSGKIIGACLDVLEEEKNIEQVLQQSSNQIAELLKQHVLITPHIAGYSYNAIEKMSAELIAQLMPVL